MLALVVSIICYFVLIPINKSISDAPNQLIGIYQSAVVIIAVFILYKTCIHKKKKPLKRAITKYKVDDGDTEWNKKTEKEQQEFFYTKLLTIVEKYEV